MGGFITAAGKNIIAKFLVWSFIVCVGFDLGMHFPVEKEMMGEVGQNVMYTYISVLRLQGFADLCASIITIVKI